MRRSTLYLAFLAAAAAALLAMLVHAGTEEQRSLPLLRERAAAAGKLGLTDLCLFTEARYTRHPSQSDLHTPFQEHPASLEHFPSGSLIAPGQHRGAP